MSFSNKKALSDIFSITHTILDNYDARNPTLSDHESDQLEGAIANQIAFIIALLADAGFDFQEKNAGSKIETFENGFEGILEKVITDIQDDTKQKLNQILEKNKEILTTTLKKLTTNLNLLYTSNQNIGQMEEQLKKIKMQRMLLDEMSK